MTHSAKRSAFFALFLLFSLASCSTSRIYIVRHGDRLDKTDDSPLSPAGEQRAVALADSLINKSIDSLYVTNYIRTRNTARPLAERLNKPTTEYLPRPVDAIVVRLKKLKNKNALVVGHSDTILDIVKGLGATPTLPKIESGDYDNLFLVTIKKTPFNRRVTLREGTYGVATLP